MGLLSKVSAVVIVLLLVSIHPNKACRVLEDKGVWENRGGLLLGTLQKGPVPPSGNSGCTYVPGKPGPSCPVKEMNVAGNALARAAMNY
ncbi:putative transmembrane protein [Cinnamomum micranthum f. kanehirae]|uniref:Putative transmembrane protein n=1 Tax=Cinnamomum micranthum f. kanehirae TaxID=337451 RepID=A0A443PF75_9MAGN|nr:putative transmembrane protein [Cinnamomum micranthum f. kanehirae]